MFYSCKQGELGLPGPAGVDGEKVIIRSTHLEEYNFLIYIYKVLQVLSSLKVKD